MSTGDPPPTPQHRRRRLSLDDYEAGVLGHDVALLARALTLIESSKPSDQHMAQQLLARLVPHTGQAIRVGITGVPGVGKSTFIDALGTHLLELGHRVAVLAVDPSSGLSGGSILGDKTRMPRLSAEADAFIRPAPTAGTLGGVAGKTRESMLVCEAAGYNILLVETVGVGQSETMVAEMTDCFLALMLPGAGDELQGIKRGLLEWVDVIAVNKADGGMKLVAETAAGQLRLALRSLASSHGHDSPVVLTCSALSNQGIDAVWAAIRQRHEQLAASSALGERRRQQNLRWMWNVVDEQIYQAVHRHPAVIALANQLEEQVLTGSLAPAAAARQLLEAIGLSGANAGQ